MAGKALALKGSCHCQAIRFHATTHTPHPIMACYCGICRKLQGGTGGTINIQADMKSFQIDEGEDYVSTYRAVTKVENGKAEKAGMLRSFCRRCGSFVWGFAPEAPESIFPYATAIDTDLPEPPEQLHIFLDHKASWVKPPQGKEHLHYGEMPPIEIEDWHKKKGLYLD